MIRWRKVFFIIGRIIRIRLIFHINGCFHSDGHLGTVEKLEALNPALKVGVITPKDMPESKNYMETYADDKKDGEYIIYFPRVEKNNDQRKDIMMKIKNKQFFNRKILMTLVVGTNVILGGTAVYAEEPQKFTLDEYVVTATRTELSRKEVPQSVEVITKEDIQNIGATNVIDALRTATNIEIPEAAGVGHTLGIRGSGKNDVLVLLNGRRIPGEGYGQVSTNTYVLSRLNVNNIERIEVLRGPSGALYGSEASAGVINIITKKSEKKINDCRCSYK